MLQRRDLYSKAYYRSFLQPRGGHFVTLLYHQQEYLSLKNHFKIIVPTGLGPPVTLKLKLELESSSIAFLCMYI